MFGAARVSRGEPTGDGPTWQEVGARKPRSVLAALALHAGRPVSADVLADLVWAGEPPRAAHGALHAYISGVRKSLDPDRTTRSVASVLETTDHGYLLRVEADDVDAHRFVRDVRRIERVLAPLATQLTSGDRNDWPDRGTVLAALDELDAVLATWTGTPYADLLEHPDVVAERAALEQVRTAAEQCRLLGLLALGEPASVLATTEARVASQPAAGALVGAARTGADPSRPAGRGPRRLAGGPQPAGRGAGPRPRTGAARPGAGDPAAGVVAGRCARAGVSRLGLS